MLISSNLHKKSREVSIKTKSPPASFSFKDQATKHTTVKWSIVSVKQLFVQINLAPTSAPLSLVTVETGRIIEFQTASIY